MRFAHFLTSGLTALSAILVEAFNGDTFLGPIFTAPVNLSRSLSLSSSLGQMTQDITTALDAAFGKETGNSVAICGFSIHDSGESPLFDYYHTANGLSPNGTNSVGPDTVFRIGSISKLFTVYQLLLHGGHDLLNEPISRYLDDLPADNGYNTSPTVKWDEIEVGALAGQMGGILRDYNHADLAGSNLPFQKLGLPKLSDKDTPHCDGNLSQPLCSRKDFLQGLDQQPPVFPVWETPAYSNAAFRILGYVAANFTNITMVDAFGAAIFRPLGLEHTYASKPPDFSGVIPATGESLWDFELGDDMLVGGIYSSARGLAVFSKAILQNTQLPPVVTRRWLKPITHTSSLYFSVGQPWEIYRLADSGHVVDYYNVGMASVDKVTSRNSNYLVSM